MKQLSRFWNRQSLREKFLLIIIPASMLSSVLIMLLAYMIFGEYEQKLYQVARQNLRLMVGKIEKELMEAEDFGVDLATDETVQEALKSERANIRTRRVSMDYIRLAQQVYKVLQKGLAQNRNILSISILWKMSGTMRALLTALMTAPFCRRWNLIRQRPQTKCFGACPSPPLPAFTASAPSRICTMGHLK